MDHSRPEEPFKADETFTLAVEVSRPFCVVDYPRKEPIKGMPFGKILIQLLPLTDQIIAILDAHRQSLELLKTSEGEAYSDLYQLLLSLEILQRACFSADIHRDEGKLRPMFPPVKLLRGKLTDDEQSYLMKAYLTLQSTKGAVREFMDDEDLNFWVFQLQQDPIQSIAGLTHGGITSLLVALAKRVDQLEGQSLVPTA